MFNIEDYIKQFNSLFTKQKNQYPWEIIQKLPNLLMELISITNNDYNTNDGIAIHKTAVIESNVTLKAPVLIGPDCFIGSNAYLRGGVLLTETVSIGPGCEVKTSIIFPGASIAHFNFIGDSIIGRNVNFEAGAITANHFNERENKRILAYIDSIIIDTGIEKFGSLIGDNSKIGANAVLSPGTVLIPGTIVKRLELIDQIGLLKK